MHPVTRGIHRAEMLTGSIHQHHIGNGFAGLFVHNKQHIAVAFTVSAGCRRHTQRILTLGKHQLMDIGLVIDPDIIFRCGNGLQPRGFSHGPVAYHADNEGTVLSRGGIHGRGGIYAHGTAAEHLYQSTFFGAHGDAVGQTVIRLGSAFKRHLILVRDLSPAGTIRLHRKAAGITAASGAFEQHAHCPLRIFIVGLRKHIAAMIAKAFPSLNHLRNLPTKSPRSRPVSRRLHCIGQSPSAHLRSFALYAH